MPFEVIPAIDVWKGNLARICPGGVEPIGAFDGDPIAAAEAFITSGAKWLHVVDLDLALTGDAANHQTISLLAVMDARIQASGGIATEADVERALAAGAERVVLGSAALADRDLVQRSVARFGEALAVAVEVEGDRIRPRGLGALEFPLEDTLSWLSDLEVSRFVYVSVDRVGEMSGPDIEGLSRVAWATRRPVIASGGIATAEDVRAVASLAPMVQGVIVGRALYEGELTVRDAIRVALETAS